MAEEQTSLTKEVPPMVEKAQAVPLQAVENVGAPGRN